MRKLIAVLALLVVGGLTTTACSSPVELADDCSAWPTPDSC
jgi:hypothetical protein